MLVIFLLDLSTVLHYFPSYFLLNSVGACVVNIAACQFIRIYIHIIDSFLWTTRGILSRITSLIKQCKSSVLYFTSSQKLPYLFPYYEYKACGLCYL